MCYRMGGNGPVDERLGNGWEGRATPVAVSILAARGPARDMKRRAWTDHESTFGPSEYLMYTHVQVYL